MSQVSQMSPARRGRFAAAMAVALGVVLGVSSGAYATRAPKASAGKAPRAVPTASVTVQTNFAFDGTQAAFFVAKYDGFFARQHLDVTIIPGQVAATGLTNVIAGKVDFALTSFSLLPAAIQAGAKVKAIMLWYQHTAMAVCALASKHKLTKPASLKGLTIALPQGSTTQVFTPVLLRINHVPVNSIHPENIAASLYVSALFNGEVDVIPCFLNESYWVSSAEAAKLGEKLSVLPFAKFGVNPYDDVVVASDATLAHRPGVVRRFLKALVGAELYMRSHTSAAVRATLDAQPSLNPTVVAHQIQVTAGEGNVLDFDLHGYGWFNSTLVRQSLALFRRGGIPGARAVTPGELYTNAYLPGKS
ncbi:MAG TPA: ABC transporter substrate-binding protein [Acidimicrobiales bacterium]|nr:ABC transporter substrate-binding protein [Acidimicrobiales bacterium]